MKGKKLIIYICFSLLIVALSFVAFYGFSDVEKTDIQNVAFIFTVITEVVFFAMIYLGTDERNNTFSKSGVISATVIYALVSLILNIFFKMLFSTVRILVTTNVLLLIVYVAIVLLIYLAKKER